MNKNIKITVAALVALLMVGAYVAYVKSNPSDTSGINQLNSVTQTEDSREQRPERVDIFADITEVKTEDLRVGESVFVIGEESNGIIVASRVMVGIDNFEIQRQPNNVATEISTEGRDGNPSTRVPQGNSNFDRTEFENLTEEERAERRAEIGNRGRGSLGDRQRVPDAGRLQGGAINEGGSIIKVDDTSLTIQSSGGGSKIVFFDDETLFIESSQ